MPSTPRKSDEEERMTRVIEVPAELHIYSAEEIYPDGGRRPMLLVGGGIIESITRDISTVMDAAIVNEKQKQSLMELIIRIVRREILNN